MSQNKNSLIKDCDLFVFDWDGTLNSMRITMRINESIKRALGIWNTDSSIKDFKHVDYDLKKKLKNEERKNDFMTYLFDFLLNISRPRLRNDSLELLKYLHKKGKKIAIFSNGRSHRVIRELRILGIVDYFDSIVSARDLNTLKPNPSGLKVVLNSTKVKASRCVYIGDMVDDIITAKLAHVSSCGVAGGFDSYHRLGSIHPDYLFKSLADMNRSLKK
jgi:HAD superfamily hydrolase (TIGR01509 family)